MLEGLYSAAAGMAAQQDRLDAVSDDIANASTPGYRRSRVAFRDLLYVRGTSAGSLAGAGAAADVVGRSLGQGPLQPTDRALDFALQGPGYFAVRRPDGSIALTRSGAFEVDARGRLCTSQGYLLQPPVHIPRGVDANAISVSPDGTVSAPGRGRPLGHIRLMTVRSPDGLAPAGDNLYVPTAASGPATPTRGTSIVQGALEGSNVDVADAMVDLIDAQRSFQLASRAVQVQDQLLEIANGVKR